MVDNYKLIIVLRQKFPNNKNNTLQKIRTGKYVAQGGHAVQLSVLDAQKKYPEYYEKYLDGRITKVCVYVETEKELLELWDNIKDKNVPKALIKDSGLTEFGGEKTYTAIGIGPVPSDIAKELTGHLPLF